MGPWLWSKVFLVLGINLNNFVFGRNAIYGKELLVWIDGLVTEFVEI